MAISLTVRELLTAQELAETELIAGAGGLDRPVRGVNVMEAPDIARWLRGGELLLSTGYQFCDQPDDFDDLVIALKIWNMVRRAIASEIGRAHV